jgi:hypothetical protein
LVPASAKIDASQSTRTPNVTFTVPETAKAPSWQRVAATDGEDCSRNCGASECNDREGRNYLCKVVSPGDKTHPRTCQWTYSGPCAKR